MMANKLLKSGVINVLFPIARKLKKGQSRVIQKTISMIIDTGENINGYQYLHGTNSRVGGFQMYGKISKLLNGTVIYDMTYVWNDIIDPNYTYDSDRIKAKIAKIIANPKNYVIKIIWNDISVIYPNTGKGTGWLGKR